MSDGATEAAEFELDESLLHEMVAAIGDDFASAGQASVMSYIGDPRVSPTLLTMAVVRAHMLGAASMLAAHTDGDSALDAAAWLLEAFAEARLSVDTLMPGTAK